MTTTGFGVMVTLMLSWLPRLWATEQLHCLQGEGLVNRREMYYNSKSLTLMLESSHSVSHNITNQILRTLLTEIVGYHRVQIQNEFSNTLNTTAILNRMSGCYSSGCTAKSKSVVPRTMINIEVPVVAGFLSNQWNQAGTVVSVGALGPLARPGWYIADYTIDKLWETGQIADHWRSLLLEDVTQIFSMSDQLPVLRNLTKKANGGYLCNFHGCVQGIYYGPRCPQTDQSTCAVLLSSYPEWNKDVLIGQVETLDLLVNIAWLGDHYWRYISNQVEQRHPVLLFGLHPDIIALGADFTRIRFPTCKTLPTNFPVGCDYETNQFTKFVWSKIKTNAPEAYYVISKFHFEQLEFESLLKNYSISKSVSSVACDWLNQNRHKWLAWIPKNLSMKQKIYLLGFFPVSGVQWTQPGLVQGAELALDRVNKNPGVLPNHDLELIIVDSQCKADVAMREYIKYIHNSTNLNIAGVLGPACSDEAESIASLSKHFYMFTVSYSAEASSLSDRVTYPYFYRTIPQISVHKYVYEQLFNKLEWHQVGALAEAGQELPEYHLLLQDHLQKSGVKVVIRHDIVQTHDHSYDVTQIFADLRARNVRIIIADFYVGAARAIMCEAYRQRMTAHEGYVWFLPSLWYSVGWWQVRQGADDIPCTTQQMLYAIDGHFILSKTFADSDQTVIMGNFTVGMFKKLYAERVGRAQVKPSPYATYVYDAVWVYALGLNKLLSSQPGALELLHQKSTADTLVHYINETDFQGVSGRVRFEGGDRPGQIQVMQVFHNITRVVGKYTPGVPAGAGTLDLYQSHIRWLTPGGHTPSDGQPEEKLCVIEDFREMFSVSCEMSIVIANVIGFGVFVILVVFVLVVIKFRSIDFLTESEIMKRFSHPNIVKLLGVCTRGEPVLAIMEYHLHGDLKTYLLSRRSLVGQATREAEDISAERLTQMVLDITSGLKYIHDLRYVHRDLACRNCLVHANQTVKIGDFGMTRTLIESDYYRFTKKGMLPVRWMSPESLWDGMFTSKSDIWSFGILVFEVVTFGSFPYQGLSNNQVLEFVKKGNRLILPGNCPEDLCDFIHSCLSYEANDRPDIEDIFDKLMKDPTFIQPCLDAPTTSVVIEDMESMELVNASCQNTITKSHSVLPTLLNRLSQTSQDVKRLSAGSQGNKLSTPTKLSIKTFVPSIFTRSRSNSLDLVAQSPCKKDLCNQFEEIQDYESPDNSETAIKSNHNSHEIHVDSGYSQYPLLSPGERGDSTSDYFSDKDQLTVLEMCETITSV
ncbi:uncharacterized protein LOC132561632 [Ylistrum balloti]|uniref:uncharacterized protein LOC132561632 n=1 Tax=Ylistrum balloti TaxID=509963 RepID=UPI002905C051|nr:uncharacterized protein LOC132561632 [Ylistrum balloti]